VPYKMVLIAAATTLLASTRMALSQASTPTAPAPPTARCTPVIVNPRVTCDRWPSNYDAKSWINDVWRLEHAATGEQKTLALYKWVRLQQHWGTQCHDGTRGQSCVECDAIKKINIYPYGECSDFGVTSAAMGHAGGLQAQEAHVPGHTQLEVFYKDADAVERWHRLDPFWGVVVYDKTASHVATSEEIRADPNVALHPSKTVLPWGDKTTDRPRFAEKAAFPADRRVRPSIYTMDEPLYAGETYTLSWQRDDNVPFVNANPDARDSMSDFGFQRYAYAHGDLDKLAFEHDLIRPYAETVGDRVQIRQAHGTLLFNPRLDEGFQDSLYTPAVNVATASTGPIKLHPAAPGIPAELIYLLQTPYVIADAALTGDFLTASDDKVRVSIAYADWHEQGYTLIQAIPDNPTWKPVWESTGPGPQTMRRHEADLKLRGEYKCLVKLDLLAAKDPTTVGVANLGFQLTFQEGVMALPRLMPGKNVIHVAADQIKPGYRLRLTYCWDDTAGTQHQQTTQIDRVPFTFDITAAGDQPADVRTRYLTLEAAQQSK
jgi:hypothetical protein